MLGISCQNQRWDNTLRDVRKRIPILSLLSFAHSIRNFVEVFFRRPVPERLFWRTFNLISRFGRLNSKIAAALRRTAGSTALTRLVHMIMSLPTSRARCRQSANKRINTGAVFMVHLGHFPETELCVRFIDQEDGRSRRFFAVCWQFWTFGQKNFHRVGNEGRHLADMTLSAGART